MEVGLQVVFPHLLSQLLLMGNLRIGFEVERSYLARPFVSFFVSSCVE